MSAAVTTPDAAIIAAFEQRAGAYVAYIALPDGEGPEATKLRAEVDAAEAVINESLATTPRGAELQLWVALSHSTDDREKDARSYVADFAFFDADALREDWEVRLIVTAIRSLRAMGGAA